MAAPAFIPYKPYRLPDASSPEQESADFYARLDQRRSLRAFSDQPVSQEVIEHLLLAAGTAPSGAHMQPWTFCAVSDPAIKRRIREAAEAEEYENYHGRMPASWLQDLEAFGTDWQKPFLEIAPWLIVVFKQSYRLIDGAQRKNYYVNESVGIACGMLLAAIHLSGLVCLTHTPSPMNFLQEILGRPENEKPYLLIPLGYPAADAGVPDLQRKSLAEMAHFFLPG